jgi:hypothetical protein
VFQPAKILQREMKQDVIQRESAEIAFFFPSSGPTYLGNGFWDFDQFFSMGTHCPNFGWILYLFFQNPRR